MPENIIEELNELLDLTQAMLDAVEQIPHPMADEIHAKYQKEFNDIVNSLIEKRAYTQ